MPENAVSGPFSGLLKNRSFTNPSDFDNKSPLDLDYELINHLANPDSVNQLQTEQFKEDLLEDSLAEAIFRWQLNHVRENKNPASKEVLQDEFPGLEIEEPKTSIGDLISRLRQRYIRNQGRSVIQKIAEAAVADPLAVAKEMLREGRKLDSLTTPKGEVFGEGDHQQALAGYDLRATRGQGPSLGFYDVDRHFNGQEGITFFVGAPKSMKSWFAINSVLSGIEEGQFPYLYSLELPAIDSLWRLKCMKADIPYWKYLKGQLDLEDRRVLSESAQELEASKFRIEKPKPGERRAVQLVEKALNAGASCIYIDQLQYIEASNGSPLGALNETGRYFEVCSELRDFSDEIPIFVVHQFNRCFPPGSKVTLGNGTRKSIELISRGDGVLTRKGEIHLVNQVMSRTYQGEVINLDTGTKKIPLTCTPNHHIWAIKSNNFSKKSEFRNQSDVHIRARKSNPEPQWIPAEFLGVGDFIELNYRNDLIDAPIFFGNDPIFDEGYCQCGCGNPAPIAKVSRTHLGHKKGQPVSYITGHVRRSPPRRFELTPEFYRLFGFYLAEGSISGQWVRPGSPQDHTGTGRRLDHIDFTFHENETDFVNFVQKECLKIWGKAEIQPEPNHSTLKVVVNDTMAAQALYRWAGRGCADKYIPDELMDLAPRFQAEILLGWWLGDGHREEGRASGISVNKPMIEQLQQMALRCGLACSITPTAPKDKNCQDRYTLGFQSVASEVLAQWEKKGVQLGDAYENTTNFIWIDKRCFTRVTRIYRTDYEGLVYDLEIDEDHSYTVNGLAVHNSIQGSESLPDFQQIKGSAAIEETGTLALAIWANKDMRKSNLVQLGTLLSRHYMIQNWEIGIELSQGCKLRMNGKIE